MRWITSDRRPLVLFLLAGLTVYAVAIALMGSIGGLDRPGAVALGVTLDLVVLVPLLGYLILVRRGRMPAVGLIPLAFVGLLAATAILPPEHQGTLRVLEAVVLPLEIGLLGWIVHRATRAARTVARDAVADPVETYRNAARSLVTSKRVAGVVATELALLHYAFASWRSRPSVPAGAAAFTQHVRSGANGLAFGLGFLLVAEGLALHLWIHTWSPTLAWIVSLTNVYALVLVVADARATVLRPTFVLGDELVVRHGVRWTLEVPRARVVDVTVDAPDRPRHSLLLVGEPTTWIVFDGPVTLRGVYGTTRTVGAVGLTPDDVDGLRRALRSR